MQVLHAMQGAARVRYVGRHHDDSIIFGVDKILIFTVTAWPAAEFDPHQLIDGHGHAIGHKKANRPSTEYLDHF
jgi:hypothetical protein